MPNCRSRRSQGPVGLFALMLVPVADPCQIGVRPSVSSLTSQGLGARIHHHMNQPLNSFQVDRGMKSVLTMIVLAIVSGCAEQPAPPAPRGIILISLDTLSAAHLGLFEYDRETSPFLDSLGRRSVVFENAIVQLPGTLPSHMSIFTGLYPSEHDVFPVDSVLSSEIPTFPELLQGAGIRTGGHTEDGYVSGRYGFSRGFDEWDDHRVPLWYGGDNVFVRGLRFLEGIAPEQSYFLFLHTYAVHDPYNPPNECRTAFWQGEPPRDAPPPTSETLLAHNNGTLTVTPEVADYFRALYDAEILCLDGYLERFFANLDEMGLLDDALVIITSDHGEEFLEHGKMAHDQIYNENLHVPLIMVFPGQENGRRVAEIVESIDIMPTILELAGLGVPEHISGRSLLPVALGTEDHPEATAYSRSFRASGREERSLFRRDNGEVFHLVSMGRDSKKGGGTIGVASRLQTRIPPGEIVFKVKSYEVPSLLTVTLDSERLAQIELAPDRWSRISVPAGSEPKSRVLRLASDTCFDLEGPEGAPQRCRSFVIRGLDLRRHELYRVERDTWEADDLAFEFVELGTSMLDEVESRDYQPVSDASQRVLEKKLEEELRALGYIE